MEKKSIIEEVNHEIMKEKEIEKLQKSQNRQRLALMVKQYRQRLGMTQETFSERAGISYTYYRQLETGHRYFNYNNLCLIVRAFKGENSPFTEMSSISVSGYENRQALISRVTDRISLCSSGHLVMIMCCLDAFSAKEI